MEGPKLVVVLFLFLFPFHSSGERSPLAAPRELLLRRFEVLCLSLCLPPTARCLCELSVSLAPSHSPSLVSSPNGKRSKLKNLKT